jgi:hypothetical protein
MTLTRYAFCYYKYYYDVRILCWSVYFMLVLCRLCWLLYQNLSTFYV